METVKPEVKNEALDVRYRNLILFLFLFLLFLKNLDFKDNY